MICVVIKGPTIESASQQIAQAISEADLVELRLDLFTQLGLEALKALRREFSIPMIFTLRSLEQGGHYTDAEEKRLQFIRKLLELQPEYFDIEYDVPSKFLEEITSAYPSTKFILSYHNFVDTPDGLQQIYQTMRKVPIAFYKMAVTAKNSADALRFISWAKDLHDKQLIPISMGSHGQISRILAPVIGSPFTYASLDKDHESAPGQLPAKILIERYHYRSLHTNTPLYGLIGDPITPSISDETHNHLMATCGINGVYIKMQVASKELGQFLAIARNLRFQGLSVTMPLKEEIIGFVDVIDPKAHEIGAVNTLHFENGKIIGFNTDGIGAATALERIAAIKGKRILILGAGGACRAIAYEICQRGGIATILNRDANKAEEIARQLGCRGMGLDQINICIQEEYDILINCTPMPLPISLEDILPGVIVMDIMTKPKETPLLEAASKKGCRLVYGYEMFVEQALGQYTIWLKEESLPMHWKKTLETKALEVL